MNVECSNFKFSIETCFILESIYSVLLVHFFFHSTNYKGLTIYLMCLHCRLLTNKLKIIVSLRKEFYIPPRIIL